LVAWLRVVLCIILNPTPYTFHEAADAAGNQRERLRITEFIKEDFAVLPNPCHHQNYEKTGACLRREAQAGTVVHVSQFISARKDACECGTSEPGMFSWYISVNSSLCVGMYASSKRCHGARVRRSEGARGSCSSAYVQGYLAHKKAPPPRTLQ
jgi:hypothetical protein